MTTNFMGKDGFVWWQGVVEDRKDPLKLGRCRVRILGWHTENKQSIPTNTLPWAHPLQPITSAAMNGIGETPLGPVEGTWVMGFFRDGEDAQEPVMMGTIGGIPEDVANTKKGFNDPNGTYPKSAHLNKPDTNRLARNEEISDTIVQTKRNNLDSTVTATGVTWSEPTTPYDAVYPYNHVQESESGHISEVDDTPGNERLHKYHKKGTFEEIHPDGKKVTKVVADNYTLVAGSDYVHIKGSCNITIDQNATLYELESWRKLSDRCWRYIN
jgi:hypothetical protein